VGVRAALIECASCSGERVSVLLTVENQSFNAKVGQEETETVSELVVSQGSAPNFVVKFDFHTTINPNGTVTSYFNNFTTECQGRSLIRYKHIAPER